MRNLLRHILALPKEILCMAITVYQHTLSPDHGPLKVMFPHGCCMHEPTCSEYGKQVIQERGAVVGSLLAIKHILSCYPWAKVSDEKILKTLSK